MTSTDVATRPPTVPINRKTGKPLKVTGKASLMLDRMIEEGETYQDAAKAVGMHVRHARKAIDSPHVLNELRRRKQVFRASISAANIHHLAKLRDKSGNAMAQLGAIKVLEQIDDDPQSVAARSRAPGVVINIVGAASLTPQQPRNGANPLIEHEPRSSSPADDDE